MTDEQKKTLEELASQYVQYKSELDPLDKKCKSINTSLKGLMELTQQDEVELSDGTKVKYSVTERTTFDEEKLIKQLKHFAPDTECIKTKEYVDMDILESEIYHGKLSNDAMVALDSCRETKEIPKLEIKKKKSGK